MARTRWRCACSRPIHAGFFDRLGGLEPARRRTTTWALARRGHRADRARRAALSAGRFRRCPAGSCARRADRESGSEESRQRGARRHRSPARWRAFRCNRQIHLAPGQTRDRFVLTADRLRASRWIIRRSGGRSAWANIRCTDWSWPPAVDGATSDRASATFGIRSVQFEADQAGLSPVLHQRQAAADPRRGLGAGHVPAR